MNKFVNLSYFQIDMIILAAAPLASKGSIFEKRKGMKGQKKQPKTKPTYNLKKIAYNNHYTYKYLHCKLRPYRLAVSEILRYRQKKLTTLYNRIYTEKLKVTYNLQVYPFEIILLNLGIRKISMTVLAFQRFMVKSFLVVHHSFYRLPFSVAYITGVYLDNHLYKKISENVS